MNFIMNGKIVGYIKDNTYVTERKKIHFMKKYQGFGISQNIIDKLLGLNIYKIKILYDGDKPHTYVTDIGKFNSSYKTFNFNDCDLQKFVSSRDMVEIKPQRILV